MIEFSDIERQALAAAAQAGGSPASYGALPAAEDLPLLCAVLETRLDMIQQRLERLENGH